MGDLAFCERLYGFAVELSELVEELFGASVV